MFSKVWYICVTKRTENQNKSWKMTRDNGVSLDEILSAIVDRFDRVDERLGKIEDRLGKIEGRLKDLESGQEGIMQKLNEIESEFGEIKGNIERNTLDIRQIKDHLKLP